MRELLATGFMSNRGRQNVASYLIFDLAVDWRYGAAHFEEHLLDHDPTSNWGNWVAAAGLTGQRVNKFNTKKQLNDYDPKREYVRHWLSDSDASTPARRVVLEKSSLPEPSEQKGKGKGNGKGKSKGGREEGLGDAKRTRRWQSKQRVEEEAWGA